MAPPPNLEYPKDGQSLVKRGEYGNQKKVGKEESQRVTPRLRDSILSSNGKKNFV